MSVRLEVTSASAADPGAVWSQLVDWAGQRHWIPLTTVRVSTPYATGLGVRCEALSGFWLGRLPVGLLDRFVVTGWTPPTDGPGELEVLHLGPYFTGPGMFRVEARPDGSTIRCTEVFTLPGGRLPEALARLALPFMRAGIRLSLRRLARLSEAT